MPPPKSKVQFSESQTLRMKELAKQATPPGSENGIQTSGVTTSKKKGRKSRVVESGSEFLEEEPYDNIVRMDNKTQKESTALDTPMFDLMLSDPDKNVSDGSTSDREVPQLKWQGTTAGGERVCPVSEANKRANYFGGGEGCNVGVMLSKSQKISPCIKSDGQTFATTDYATSAALSLIPTLIHPVNGQMSTSTRHREFTNYLRNSSCLRMFGSCILAVYRMKTWPPPEKLIEQILNSMGHQIPAKKQVEELKNRKQALITKLKLLTKERCQLLERLDKFQDCAAKYDLLDQDEILPPRPENSPLDMEQMIETFRNVKFADAGWEDEDGRSTELKVILSRPAPVEDALIIPYHDKRMLQ